jgi:hypothetical protein
MKHVPFEELTHARFSTLVNTHFRAVVEGGGEIDLVLVEAKQLHSWSQPDSPGSAQKGECFSLVFNGPASRFLEQMTHELKHEQLGAFPLFLVPIGKTQEGFQYEAIFNRLS